MSILAVANIRGTTASGNIVTVPTGHVLKSADAGGIYIPGSVTQVYQGIKTDTFSAAPNGTWTTVTGLSVTIAPKTTTSKIVVMISLVGAGSGTTPKARLTRNGAAIGVGATSGSKQLSTMGTFLTIDNNQSQTLSHTFVDLPASTSIQTYAVQINNDNTNTVYINRSVTDSDNATGGRYISTITVMEVAV